MKIKARRNENHTAGNRVHNSRTVFSKNGRRMRNRKYCCRGFVNGGLSNGSFPAVSFPKFVVSMLQASVWCRFTPLFYHFLAVKYVPSTTITYSLARLVPRDGSLGGNAAPSGSSADKTNC